MIYRWLIIVILLVFVITVFADDEIYTGRILPENVEDIDYSLNCECLVPAINIVEWSEENNDKLVLDQTLRPANDYVQTLYDVKYFNGPWSWTHDFGRNGVTCVRNIHHRGFIVRHAAYETYAERDEILNEWNNNPVEWRPPNTIITYRSTEPKPNYDNIPK